MSWIERTVEQRLAQAARNGELSVPHLEGRPIADLDRQRPDGWWAERFVRRERSHDRRQAALAEAAVARAGFWRAADVDELHARVAATNAELRRVNAGLVDDDVIELFDPADVERRWRELHDA